MMPRITVAEKRRVEQALKDDYNRSKVDARLQRCSASLMEFTEKYEALVQYEFGYLFGPVLLWHFWHKDPIVTDKLRSVSYGRVPGEVIVDNYGVPPQMLMKIRGYLGNPVVFPATNIDESEAEVMCVTGRSTTTIPWLGLRPARLRSPDVWNFRKRLVQKLHDVNERRSYAAVPFPITQMPVVMRVRREILKAVCGVMTDYFRIDLKGTAATYDKDRPFEILRWIKGAVDQTGTSPDVFDFLHLLRGALMPIYAFFVQWAPYVWCDGLDGSRTTVSVAEYESGRSVMYHRNAGMATGMPAFTDWMDMIIRMRDDSHSWS
jgi:hypothetical protein